MSAIRSLPLIFTLGALAGCLPEGDPLVGLDRDAIEWGQVAIGEEISTELVVTNLGSDVPLITIIVDGEGFGGTFPEEGISLNPDESFTLRLQFSPNRLGPYDGTLEVWARGSSRSINLSGEGI